METLQGIYIRQKRVLFFLLALFVLGWALTDFKPVFAGLIVGSLFGLYNFWILVRRMERFDKIFTEGKKKASLGMMMRFASGVAAAAVAISLPEHFNLVSSVIGLMIPYILLVAGGIIFRTKNH